MSITSVLKSNRLVWRLLYLSCPFKKKHVTPGKNSLKCSDWRISMITLLCSAFRFNCVDVAVEYYLSERWQLEMLILTPWWRGKVKHCFQQNDRPVENTKDCFKLFPRFQGNIFYTCWCLFKSTFANWPCKCIFLIPGCLFFHIYYLRLKCQTHLNGCGCWYDIYYCFQIRKTKTLSIYICKLNNRLHGTHTHWFLWFVGTSHWHL